MNHLSFTANSSDRRKEARYKKSKSEVIKEVLDEVWDIMNELMLVDPTDEVKFREILDKIYERRKAVKVFLMEDPRAPTVNIPNLPHHSVYLMRLLLAVEGDPEYKISN